MSAPEVADDVVTSSAGDGLASETSMTSVTTIESARALARDVVRSERSLAVTISALSIVTVVLEGATIALAFPILEELGGSSDGADPSGVGRAIRSVFDVVGLRPTVLVLSAAALVLSVTRWILLLWHGAACARLRYRYVQHVRDELYTNLLRARWPFFWSLRVGSVTNLLVAESEIVGGLVTHLQIIVANVAALAIYLTVAVAGSWTVSLTTVACGTVLLLATRPISRRMYESGAEMTNRRNELAALSEEVVGGIKTIKASSNEAVALERFAAVAERYTAVAGRNQRLYQWFNSTFEAAAASALVVILVLGTQVFDVDVATVLVVSAIFGRMFPKFAAIQQGRQMIQTYLPSIQAIDGLSRLAAHEREDHQPDADLPPFRRPPDVELAGVTVSLGGVDVLSDLDLSVRGGTHLGIVGPSGSGKSTLVNCLVRLVEVSSGRIAIGGAALEDLPIGPWRREVGYVSQETIVFNGTVRDNVLWGRTASNEAIDESLRLAGLGPLIERLPLGLDEPVGDHGQRLSGGERQRLGLARALLDQPSLLILDEATSALDAEGERAVLDALQSLPKTMTTISIAHRLAAVRSADTIAVVEHGRVTEVGSWTELVERGGRFATLLGLQSLREGNA